MKRQELCASLAKIQPSEELICSTINRINEQKLGIGKKRSMSTAMFASRLAAAVCALLVVIGASVYAPSLSEGGDADVSGVGRQAETDSAGNMGIAPASYDIEKSEMLLGIARLEHSNWAVVEANVDMCLFAEPDGQSAALYECILQLNVSHVAGSDTASDVIVPTENSTISATVRFYDADKANDFFNLSGENISFLLTAHENTWTVEDYIIHK